MHTRKNLTIYLILLVSFFISCSKIDDNPDYSEHHFEIYLLNDPNIKIGDLPLFELVNQDSQALANIELQKYPWITEDNIQMYDISSHLLYLKKSKYDFLPTPVQLDIPSSWYYKPFMVVADGVRRYVGSFRGFVDVDVWPVPVIDCSYNFLYPEDLLTISWQWFNHEDTDNRNDDYVKEALSKAKISHKGLELRFKGLSLIENSDIATIQYTFTIINNDVDNLYVLDPNKMGQLFHGYNIGPQFIREGESFVRTAAHNKSTTKGPSYEWDPNWFIKLNSNDSITRTISLKGYPYFPPGNYTGEVTYQCIRKISKSERTLSDGRYWIGPTKSNLIGFKLD